MSVRKKVLVITGPTAAGKSAAALRIAQRTGGEIVSADSVQIYRYLDIGSAKATEDERATVPHHCIDLIEPNEKYSVALFEQEAKRVIGQLHAEDKLPIVVGGTGLYVNALTYPMEFTPAAVDETYRTQLLAIADESGNEELQRMLQAVDPVSAGRIMLKDTKRLVRALEVFHITGQPMSSFEEQYRKKPMEYDICMIGITMPREQLYQRINHRVDLMLQQGLIKETEMIQERYPLGSVADSTIGYKQILSYLRSEMNLEEAVELIKRDTRRFAKRQYTWFRRDERIQWLDISQLGLDGIEKKIMDIIQA